MVSIRRLLLAASLAACSADAGAPPNVGGGSTNVGSLQCPAGLTARGDACESIAALDCPASTMPLYGSEACAPVGIASCAAGWSRDDSGWGCIPDLPPNDCPAGTRAAVGEKACAPVGDCAAPFPPADATLFVDGGSGANHYATIGAALKAAAAGAVIAIGPGVYKEQVSINRPVTLVGKCPKDTIVDDTGTKYAAFLVDADGKVALRNLAIAHQTGGGIDVAFGEVTVSDVAFDDDAAFAVHAFDQGHVTVERSRIAGVRRRAPLLYGAGITVELGGQATVRDTSIVGVEGPGLAAVEKKASLDAERVLVSGVRNIPSSSEGETSAIMARSGAHLGIAGSFIHDVKGGHGASAAGADLSIARSRIDGVVPTSDSVGVSLYVVGSGHATLEESTIADVKLLGAYVDGDGSTLASTSSVVSGPKDTTGVRIGRGAQTVGSGRATIRKSAFVRLSSAGVAFQEAGVGTIEDSYVRDVAAIAWPQKTTVYGGFGVLAEGSSKVTATRVTVDRATLSGLSANAEGTLSATEVVVRNVQELALGRIGSCAQVVYGRMELASFSFERCAATAVVVSDRGTFVAKNGVCADTVESTDHYANGLTFHAGALADVESVYLVRNSGIALAANSARGTVRASSFLHNGIALHAQNGSFITESDAASDPADGELRVSTDNKFEANGARVGTGIVALPGE